MPKRTTTSPAAGPRTPVHGDVPEVLVDFEFDRGLLHIVVANVSDAPAHAVRVEFDKPFRGLGGEREVSSLALFRKLQFLAPHKRIETLLDSSAAYLARREPTRITATITYRDNEGRPHQRRITHDLSIYRDITYVLPPVPPIAPTSPAPPMPSPPAARRVPHAWEPNNGRSPR
jgi:hypothetical protein